VYEEGAAGEGKDTIAAFLTNFTEGTMTQVGP
jgi:hypothetical protein